MVEIEDPGRLRFCSFNRVSLEEIRRTLSWRCELVQKPVELKLESRAHGRMGKSEARKRIQSKLDEIHKSVQSKLDEIRTDFRKLETDLRTANHDSLRARKDRTTGFKRALQDVLEAESRADGEWH